MKQKMKYYPTGIEGWWTQNPGGKEVQIAINMLKGLLKWSDRLGSDEISELQEVIKLLNKNK